MQKHVSHFDISFKQKKIFFYFFNFFLAFFLTSLYIDSVPPAFIGLRSEINRESRDNLKYVIIAQILYHNKIRPINFKREGSTRHK